MDTESANQIDTKVRELERELNLVLERNRRVELEKSWETSTTRKIGIVVLTYLLTCIVFWIIGVSNFLANAFIPTIGYYLSTQSLPVMKRWWVNKYIDKE